MKVLEEEFKGNVLIKSSDKEVRIWVCDENGNNIFRFKAMGMVYKNHGDVMIVTRAEVI